jgi:hypothetical protein
MILEATLFEEKSMFVREMSNQDIMLKSMKDHFINEKAELMRIANLESTIA